MLRRVSCLHLGLGDPTKAYGIYDPAPSTDEKRDFVGLSLPIQY